MNGNLLIFSNKTSKDIILEKELRSLFSNKALFVLTQEQKEGYEYGRMDKLFLKRFISNFDQQFYICGPELFECNIKQIISELKKEIA